MEQKMSTGINAGYNEYTSGQHTPDAEVAVCTKKPLISVIVPVYNTASLLPRCFDSILNQTYKNIELILVNDGSTDGSGDVCDEYAKKDARARVIHQKNAGESGARNTGLDGARGEWIALVDCDDYIDLQMYEKLLNAATLQNTLMSACGYVEKMRNRGDKLIVSSHVPSKITAIECIEKQGRKLFHHWSALYHRKIINAPTIGSDEPHGEGYPLRYNTEVHYLGDRLFVIEALLRAGELAYIPEALYIYDCKREDNTTNSPFSEKRMTWVIAQKKIIELLEPVSPKGVQRERRKFARMAFLAIKKTLLSESAHINALYPECRKVAKGYMRYLLTDKKIKLKSKIVFYTVYIFPRFSRVVWKLRGSLKRK